ncbi:excalibur calcium-binding domain-containing protein [Rhodococcus triatomae]
MTTTVYVPPAPAPVPFVASVPEPAPAPAAVAPAPVAPPASGGYASYGSCADVRAAGAAPLYTGDPGYSRKLDRDGDGVACE